MQGILFIEGLYKLTVSGYKNETRRTGCLSKEINLAPDKWELFSSVKDSFLFRNIETGIEKLIIPRYKTDEVLFIKEPYTLSGKGYTYAYDLPENSVTRKWLKFSNKLFMPEAAAREFIKISYVHCERVQSIMNNDDACLREGIIKLPDVNGSFRGYIHCNSKASNPFHLSGHAFKDLFCSVNKKTGIQSWLKNEWVFVYGYELIKKENK